MTDGIRQIIERDGLRMSNAAARSWVGSEPMPSDAAVVILAIAKRATTTQIATPRKCESIYGPAIPGLCLIACP